MKEDRELRDTSVATGTIGADHELQIGPWGVRWLDGKLYLRHNDRMVVSVKRIDDRRAAIVAATTGPYALPNLVEISPLPLVRLGPGGDFVRDIFPQDLHGQSRHQRHQHHDKKESDHAASRPA